MILTAKKLFFKTIFIVFEDEKIKETLASGRYDSVVGITRTDLQIPLGGRVGRRDKTTAVIDLARTEDELFTAMNDTTRNEIRRTYKMTDLKIVEKDANRSGVYDVYAKFEYSQGRVPFPESNMKDCVIFSAYFKGELISSAYLDVGGNALRIRYLFSKRLKTEDTELYKTIGFAGKRLIWEMCVWGKKNNFASLDLATVNLTDTAKAGITKFKMSFGGRLAPEYSYVYKSKLFVWFEKLAVWKNYFRKLMKV